MGRTKKLIPPEVEATLYMKWRCENCGKANIGPLEEKARCQEVFCDMVNHIVSVDGQDSFFEQFFT